MKHRVIYIWVLLFVILFVFLESTNKYHYYYIEQLQLFQFSWEYINEKLPLPGGFSLLLGEFFIQFFSYPYAGALITALLLIIVSICARTIMRKILPTQESIFFYLLPALGLLLMHYDYNYLYQGIIAYLLFISAFSIYINIDKSECRIPAAALMTLVLFWWGGAIAGLFVVCHLIWELSNFPRRSYWALISVVLFIAAAMYSIYAGMLPDYNFAFLANASFHPSLEPPFAIYYAWLAILLALVYAFLCKKAFNKMTKKADLIFSTIQMVILIALCVVLIPKYDFRDANKMKKMDYWSYTEQWDEIIDASKGPLNNYLYIAYLNRALIEKRELGDRMFDFDQHGIEGFLPDWNRMFITTNLLNDIFFSMEEIAMSQRMAFEASLSIVGEHNPRNIQRLVQTNLIFGEYRVAEKYIDLLEKTIYRSWAKEQRRFLYNDAEVEADNVLGVRRKHLPISNNLFQGQTAIDNFLERIDRDPNDQVAIQCLGAIYLLQKDMQSFKTFIENFYLKHRNLNLPYSFQEAVILLEERNTVYWDEFRLSDKVRARFDDYRNFILQNRNNVQMLPQLLNRSYGNTYWYYYFYK